MRYIPSFILFLFIISCGEKHETTEVIPALRELQSIPVLEHQLSAYLFDPGSAMDKSSQKIILYCESPITIGLDLSTLSTRNIVIDRQSISLTLPKPTIWESPITVRKTTIGKNDHSTLTTTEIIQDPKSMEAAQRFVIQNIDSLQLLSKAEEQTSRLISRYLQNLGFERIHIRYASTLKN